MSGEGESILCRWGCICDNVVDKEVGGEVVLVFNDHDMH